MLERMTMPEHCATFASRLYPEIAYKNPSGVFATPVDVFQR
jgi:hypothetical protein